MPFLGRLRTLLSGKSKAARRAELEGDLGQAVRLWVEAGATEDAARVMVLRGDSDVDPYRRLPHYTQACATADETTTIGREARQKRAKLVLAIAKDGALSSARKDDVAEAAEQLLRFGDPAGAAEGFALIGDLEGEARALEQSGDVDKLEELLAKGQALETRGRMARDLHTEVDALVASGQRREALTMALEAPDDLRIASQRARLVAGRVVAPVVRVTLRGVRMTLLLGDEVTIGRTEGSIVVASNALSRRHVRVMREAGGFVVADLGSRNGTQLRGQSVSSPLRIEGALTLTLGGEVPLEVAPCETLAGALSIAVAGERYVAPLGEARVGEWRLAVAEDRWVELVTTAGARAYLGDIELSPTVTLLRGDALSMARGGGVVLSVEG